MSKYIPPAKRNNPDLGKDTTKKFYKKKVDHVVNPIKKEIVTEPSIPTINNDKDFPPLSNNTTKRDPQLGAWKNKITITPGSIKDSKKKLRSDTTVKKSKKIIELGYNSDNEDIEDDIIEDKHIYINEYDYYDSD